MAVEATAPEATISPVRVEAEARTSEDRAERWASWIVVYLAALMLSLTLGASAWALGLAG